MNTKSIICTAMGIAVLCGSMCEIADGMKGPRGRPIFGKRKHKKTADNKKPVDNKEKQAQQNSVESDLLALSAEKENANNAKTIRQAAMEVEQTLKYEKNNGIRNQNNAPLSPPHISNLISTSSQTLDQNNYESLNNRLINAENTIKNLISRLARLEQQVSENGGQKVQPGAGNNLNIPLPPPYPSNLPPPPPPSTSVPGQQNQARHTDTVNNDVRPMDRTPQQQTRNANTVNHAQQQTNSGSSSPTQALNVPPPPPYPSNLLPPPQPSTSVPGRQNQARHTDTVNNDVRPVNRAQQQTGNANTVNRAQQQTNSGSSSPTQALNVPPPPPYPSNLLPPPQPSTSIPGQQNQTRHTDLIKNFDHRNLRTVDRTQHQKKKSAEQIEWEEAMRKRRAEIGSSSSDDGSEEESDSSSEDLW